MEAVPAPTVLPLDEVADREPLPADDSVARTGLTIREGDWRDELLKTGIRGSGGQRISFVRLEPLPGGSGYTPRRDEVQRSYEERFSQTPRLAPGRSVVRARSCTMEQRQVERAIEEASSLVPRPAVVVFAAFQFDPEASKDIDETNWPGVTLLKAQMNADLLTDDLKKKRASNESFWLIGQPEVVLERVAEGEDDGQFRVSVQGFDYYNTKTGNVESGGADRSQSGCSIPTTTDAVCFLVKCSSRWLVPRTGGPSWPGASRPRSTRADGGLPRVRLPPFEAGEHGRVACQDRGRPRRREPKDR